MSEISAIPHLTARKSSGLQTREWPSRLARLHHIAEQQPLIETRPSLRALNSGIFSDNALRTVFMGIGLASGPALSESLPLDALGMLLSGELVRQAVGAERLVVLVADTHAASNGIPTLQVARRAEQYGSLLDQIRHRSPLPHMRVIMASEIHATAEYREIYKHLQGYVPQGEHEYFKREVADIEYFHRTMGGVVKVGWAMGGRSDATALRDERAFDRRFRSWMGHHVPFVYCKAGRVLDDGKRKASPYLTLDPARRLCIDPDEDVRAKLQQGRLAVSTGTFRGVCKHLSAVARTFGKLIAPVHGTVEQRVEQMLGHIFSNPMPTR